MVGRAFVSNTQDDTLHACQRADVRTGVAADVLVQQAAHPFDDGEASDDDAGGAGASYEQRGEEEAQRGVKRS